MTLQFLELEASMLAGTALPRTEVDLDYEDNADVECGEELYFN